MTDPCVDAPVPIGDLVVAVRELNATTLANAEALGDLKNETARNTAEAALLRKRSRWDRKAIAGMVVTVLVDVAFTLLILHNFRVQQCLNDNQSERNATTNAFYNAEIKKVQGQVAGLKLLGTDPRRGVTQFTVASEQYLAYVGATQKAALKHPPRSC